MRDLFPDGLVTVDGFKKLDVQDWRSKLGVFGVTGTHQTLPMSTMSPGFRARVVFCLMSLKNPHLLLLGNAHFPLSASLRFLAANHSKCALATNPACSHNLLNFNADEPTNPLDMDMIDSLALAIKKFNGGTVLVSHDFRLLEQVC